MAKKSTTATKKGNETVKKVLNTKFTCHYCSRDFVKESAFLKHSCKERKRSELMNTSNGQTALALYQLWMQISHKTQPQPDVFLSSRYFQSFIRFSKLINTGIIADTEKFIKLMIQKQIPPTIWTNDSVFVLYLEYLDTRIPPRDQAAIAVNTILKMSDELDIDTSVYFDALHINEICQLLRQRKLTPWLLLFSDKFKNLLRTATPEQRKSINALIRPEYWSYKIKKHPQLIVEMKRVVAELGL